MTKLETMKQNPWATVATAGFAAMSAVAGFLAGISENDRRLTAIEEDVALKADADDLDELKSEFEAIHPRVK